MLCEKLIDAKKKSGLTNQQIAEQSGVPLGTVNRIFSGAAVDLKFQTLQQLAPALNISLDTLEIKTPAVITQPTEQPIEHHTHHGHHKSDCPNYEQLNILIAKMDETIADLRKERHILFWCLMGLVAIIILLFMLDVALPTSGWIRY
jgi:transcriptional regulator with XRE-family HTH domain